MGGLNKIKFARFMQTNPTQSIPEPEVVWQQARALLQSKLSPAVYSTWIVANPLTKIRPAENNNFEWLATITTQTSFHATNLKKNLHGELIDSLETVLQQRVAIEYEVVKNHSAGGWQSTLGADSSQRSSGTDLENKNHWLSSTNSLIKEQGSNDLNSKNLGWNTHQTPPDTWRSNPQSNQVSPRVESLFSPTNLHQSQLATIQTRRAGFGLNPLFTFASYAVSGSNEMAHAAAVAVSQSPGSSYNPLFLYGDVGVGKTHLMHSIGNNVITNNPNANILYCTGEDFTNEIVQAIQSKKASVFKNRYRGVDLLLIDDVQFIAGKQAVQEEFFHTFNTLVRQQGQVVLTSDRPPEEIALLEKRLRSRFEAGLIVDIGQPTFELRVAILLLKAKSANLPLEIEQAKLIAQHVDSPRRLEGFISRLRSEIELKKEQFSDDLIRKLISKEGRFAKTKLLIPPQEIIKSVSNYYQLKPLSIRGMKRDKHLVRARHLAMYILKEDACLSLTEIGRWFSNRDHTSVLHAVRKVEADLLQDIVLQKDLVVIKSKLIKS